MSNGLRDKVIEWLAKGIVGAITGGSAAAFAGIGTFFGKMLISAYENALPIDFTHEGLITQALYRQWSREIFVVPASQGFGGRTVVALLLLVLLIAHVLFRSRLLNLRANLQQYPRLVRLYVGQYSVITVALPLVMLATLAESTSRFWLAAAFLLVTIPAAVYLIYYSGDLTRGAFGDTVCYLFLGLFFLSALVLLPHRYGREAFDLKLRSVTDRDLQTRSKMEQMNIRNDNNVFILDEDSLLLCQITVVGDGDSLSALLFHPKTKVSSRLEKKGIRTWVTEYRQRKKREYRASSGPAVGGSFDEKK